MSAALSIEAADRLVASALDASPAPHELAPLLRGRAREHDAEAFELLGRLGYPAAVIAAALPAARRLTLNPRQEPA